MELTPYLQAIGDDLERTTALADEPTRETAARLATALEPALRLAMTQLLSDAAAEISSRLGSDVVTVRMDGRTPQLQVTATRPAEAAEPHPADTARQAEEADDGTARVTVRLPEQLKRRAEQLAQAGSQSLNTWMVQAVRAATATSHPRPEPGRGSRRRLTGWA